MLRKPGGNLRGNTFLTGMDLTDDFEQFLRRRTFQQVTAGASLQRTLDLNITFKGSQKNNARARKFLSNRNRRIHAAHIRQSQVHERHIRTIFAKLQNRILRIGRIGYQLHI